jgi:ATP-dependent helicase HrpA
VSVPLCMADSETVPPSPPRRVARPREWKLAYPESLPITARRDEIVRLIREHPVVVVAGETGSGKTTQLPKLCLEAGRGQRGRIACTQPRRVAALSVSRRIAEELQVEWGREVGCKIRFADRTSPETTIKMMTDGMLLAEVQGDPLLREYDTIIVDEAHERSLNIDFLLGHLNQLRLRRPDLKIIITSATIDTEAFSRAFGGAPIVEVSGRLYPVEVVYAPIDHLLEEAGEFTYIEGVAEAVRRVIEDEPHGDILVFLPGERDIREATDLIAGRHSRDAEILPLFGRLAQGDQQRIFASLQRRKIILATNIAETSLTIPGIRFVIDTGLARLSRYNPRTRTKRLPIEPISQSSANQRKGRCGRVADGICIRLYSEAEFDERPVYSQPELQRANLAEVILRMSAFGLGEIETFPFIDPPQPHAVRAGYVLLQELGAMDERRELTLLGRELARLPIDPTVGRMLLQARREGSLNEALVIAAALSVQDPRERPLEAQEAADRAHREFHHPDSDFLALLNIWERYHDQFERMTQSKLRKFCRQHFLSYTRMREWGDIHAQLLNVIGEETERKPEAKTSTAPAANEAADDTQKLRVFGAPLYRAIHRSIIPGLLSNAARREEGNLFRGTGDRRVMVFPGSALFNRQAAKKPDRKPPEGRSSRSKNPDWILAAEVVETTRLYARTVARIEPQWLAELGAHICTSSVSEPNWDAEKGRVLARESVRLRGLEVLARRIDYGRIDPAKATEIFIRAALIDDTIQSPLPFLDRNRKLREKIENLRTRLRSGQLLSMDEAVYRFYAKRLENVSSVHDLNRLYRERVSREPRFLLMEEKDFFANEDEQIDPKAFPDAAQVGLAVLPLNYAYKPGQDEDGVTLRVPVVEAGELSQARLDWIAPGYLEERVLHLLRSLPKEQRRPLLPIPDRAREIAAELQPDEKVTLAEALSRVLRQRFGMQVGPDSFPPSALPDYLRPRIEIVDTDGKPLAVSRDLASARDALSSREREASQQRLPALAGPWREAAQRWERSSVTAAEFPDLPEEVLVAELAGVPVRAFPALRDENGNVAIRLAKSREEAASWTRAGLERLLENELRYELAWMQKDLKELQRLGPLIVTLRPFAELKDDAYECLRRLLCRRDLPLKGEAIRKAAAAGKEACRGQIFKLVDLIKPALELRQELLVTKKPYPGCHDDLVRLVPGDFLRRTPYEQLVRLPVYLKAMKLRAEKAAQDPQRDAERAKQVAPYAAALQELDTRKNASPAVRAHREEFRWLLEEFRISVFAQELGTAKPVSSVRLDKKLVEARSS